jgi:C-methyltransferase
VFDAAGVRDRVDMRSGGFFTHVPAGGDAYIMKRIIHDWADERAAKLLRNCRAAMVPGVECSW